MKKLIFLSLTAFTLYACSSNEKKEASDNNDSQALYEQNLAVVKSMISAFENKDMDGFMSHIADSVSWGSPMYGDTVETKAHYRESLQYWIDNWETLHLENPIFLPGVDTVTKKPDGSVRYYGQWEGVHKATGKSTSVNFYEFFNFNADHKVTNNGQFFDVGGMMNSLKE